MADLADVINPKKPLTEREKAAMGEGGASAPASDYAKKFSKPFTEADKKKQAEARIKALREHEAKD